MQYKRLYFHVLLLIGLLMPLACHVLAFSSQRLSTRQLSHRVDTIEYLPHELLVAEEEECPPLFLRAPTRSFFNPEHFQNNKTSSFCPVALPAANKSPIKVVPKALGRTNSTARRWKKTTAITLQALVALQGAILFPIRRTSTVVSALFAVDQDTIKSLGVGFALSYAILSTINGAITLSCAWYLSCKRTGLSPFLPGQWKSLAAAYGTIYAFIQIFKPFRVAGAIAMSKGSRALLQQTQQKINCSRGVAIVLQYSLGWLLWALLASMGIGLASLGSGVPVFG